MIHKYAFVASLLEEREHISLQEMLIIKRLLGYVPDEVVLRCKWQASDMREIHPGYTADMLGEDYERYY